MADLLLPGAGINNRVIRSGCSDVQTTPLIWGWQQHAISHLCVAYMDHMHNTSMLYMLQRHASTAFLYFLVVVKKSLSLSYGNVMKATGSFSCIDFCEHYVAM